jgi:hypothetical protein
MAGPLALHLRLVRASNERDGLRERDGKTGNHEVFNQPPLPAIGKISVERLGTRPQSH